MAGWQNRGAVPSGGVRNQLTRGNMPGLGQPCDKFAKHVIGDCEDHQFAAAQDFWRVEQLHFRQQRVGTVARVFGNCMDPGNPVTAGCQRRAEHGADLASGDDPDSQTWCVHFYLSTRRCACARVNPAATSASS